jgi:hypothetical protein
MSKMSGNTGGKGLTTDLHAGLTDRSPKAPSEKPKGGSVDADATRSATAPSQPTLGGRCA